MRRRYVAIAGPLKNNGLLSDQDYEKMFYEGLHPEFQRQLKTQLQFLYEAKKNGATWTMEQIKAAAKLVVPRDDVYSDIDDDSGAETMEDTEEEDISDYSASDEDDTDEDSDSKDRSSKPKKNSRASKSCRRSSSEQARATNIIDEAAKKKVRADKEMEELVQQLSTLRIDEPKYAAAYLIATERHPRITTIFPPPQLRSHTSTVFSSSTPPRVHPSYQTQRESSPHFAPSYSAMRAKGPLTCYGGSRMGHDLRRCPKMLEFVRQGILNQNQLGQYFTKDGARLSRQPGGNFADAAARLTLRSNLVVASIEVDDPLSRRGAYMA
jgi:hypothetical protein